MHTVNFSETVRRSLFTAVNSAILDGLFPHHDKPLDNPETIGMHLGKCDVTYYIPFQLSGGVFNNPLEGAGAVLERLDCGEDFSAAPARDGSIRIRPGSKLLSDIPSHSMEASLQFARDRAQSTALYTDISTQDTPAAYRACLFSDNIYRLHNFLQVPCSHTLSASSDMADRLFKLGLLRHDSGEDANPTQMQQTMHVSDRDFTPMVKTPWSEELSEINSAQARFFFNMPPNMNKPISPPDILMLHMRKNPLYNVQYAHRRSGMLAKRFGEETCQWDKPLPRREAELLFTLSGFSHALVRSLREPWHLRRYSEQLADAFFNFYHVHKNLLSFKGQLLRRVYEITDLLLQIMGVPTLS